jgi:hypothetical protein
MRVRIVFLRFLLLPVWCYAGDQVLDWVKVTDNAAVVFKNRLWDLGGTEDYYFGDDYSLKNDVWSSADGQRWTRPVEHAPWPPRAYHAAVVHDGKI